MLPLLYLPDFMYSSGFGMAAPEIHRGVYFGMTMILGFMLYRFRTTSPANRISNVDYVLVALTISYGIFYMRIPQNGLSRRSIHATDVIVGIIATILALELTRRVLGKHPAGARDSGIDLRLFRPYMPEFLLQRVQHQ